MPQPGTLVAGASLAGVRIGETAAQVRLHLGRDFGLCRGCATTTWYFTYRHFDDRGLAVEFSHRRVSAVYTLWQPPGWRGPHGLRLGDEEAAVTTAVPGVVPVACSGYTALMQRRSAYLIVGGRLWGFGLFRRGASPCR